MWRLAALFLYATTSQAGAYDFYECTDPAGAVAYSVTPCSKGHKQQRIEDNTPPHSPQALPFAGGTIKLQRGPSGHFFTTVSINGTPVRAMIDTGASMVAISAATASRIPLDRRKGRTGVAHTANGTAPALYLPLQSVELGGNTYRNIPGAIMTSSDGSSYEVLLGMSYLRNFEINTDGQFMTLRPK
ncbi:MAG: family clan aspartic protease [Rhodocyclaceae bacterium]|nr:family clan aspartic protease [Rhodocyclaceae bacterium]